MNQEGGRATVGWVQREEGGGCGCPPTRYLYRRGVCLGQGLGGGWRRLRGETGARVSQPAGLCSKRQPQSRRLGRRPAAPEAALDNVVNLINPTERGSGVCPDALRTQRRGSRQQPAPPGEALAGRPEFQAQGPPARRCWLRSPRRTVLSQPVGSAASDPL